MAVQESDRSLPESLAARVAAHRAELARRRLEQPDPLEQLRAFVRDRFDADSLLETYREYRDNELWWPEADDAEDVR